MRAIKAKLVASNVIVTVKDEELEIDFSVELGKHPVVMPISNPASDLNLIDIVSPEDLLLMQDIALEEAKQMMANG